MTARPQDPDELAYNVFAKACPSRCTLENVTGRWGGLTLGALSEGSLRFNELRRRVDGVSEKMLSQTLHALERDGLVHREAQPTNPPRVDYELTPLGREGEPCRRCGTPMRRRPWMNRSSYFCPKCQRAPRASS